MRKTNEQFIRDSCLKHGNTYDYSHVRYITWDIRVEIICKKHGVFLQRPDAHLSGKGCPKCGKERKMFLGKDEEILEFYKMGMSCRSIGKILNTSAGTIRRILARMNIAANFKIGCQPKYKVDHNYWGIIDSSVKAYLLGWMASDGWVYIQGGSGGIGICLQARDIEIIHLFKKSLGADHPIKFIKHNKYPDRKYPTLTIFSGQMLIDMAKYGIVPNKTQKISFPKIIPANLRWDFWRGEFDGDGYVGKRSITLCGSRQMIKIFEKDCINIGCITKKKKRKKSKNGNSWSIRYSGFNARKILKKMYENTDLGLSRKKEKALGWIREFAVRDFKNLEKFS